MIYVYRAIISLMGWAEHVANMGERRSTYRILMGKT
jgi:hypothetical protein